MVRVKICGIRTEEDLKVAVQKGYNAIGAVINVPKSPRNVTPTIANRLFRKIPPFISSVAVIVPNSVNDVMTIEKSVNPDIIQIHGFFEEEFYEELIESVSTKIIHALLLDKDGKSHVINEEPIKAANFLQNHSDAILIDTYIPNKMGGTGTTVNWDIASQIRKKLTVPVILSGGLNENNVIEAIQKVNPYAIDVSSGVEKSPGIKDSKKVENFIKLVKEAKI